MHCCDISFLMHTNIKEPFHDPRSYRLSSIISIGLMGFMKPIKFQIKIIKPIKLWQFQYKYEGSLSYLFGSNISIGSMGIVEPIKYKIRVLKPINFWNF